MKENFLVGIYRISRYYKKSEFALIFWLPITNLRRGSESHFTSKLLSMRKARTAASIISIHNANVSYIRASFPLRANTKVKKLK